MAGEDEIITIGLNTSNYDAGVDRAQAKMAKLRGEVGKADGAKLTGLTSQVKSLATAEDAAAAKAAHLRAESEKLEKVASLLGPQLGGVVQMMSKLGKTAGSDIGGATFAIAGLAVGLGAGLFALKSFAGGVLDTIVNVDDLADSLDVVTRNRLKDQIDSLHKSKAALDDAADGWTELKIVVSAAVDGPLSDAATVLSMVEEGWALVGEAASKAGIDIRDALGPLGTSLKLMEALAKIKNLLDGKSDLGPGGGETLPKDWTPGETGMSIPPTPPAVAPKPAAQTATNRPRAAAGPDAIQSSMFLAGITIPKSQIDLHAAGLDAINQLDTQFADKKAALDKQIADAAIEQIEREKAARQAAVQTAIAATEQMATSLVSLGMQLVDAQVANTKEGTEAHRQALRDQLIMQEAAAAQAALGIVNIWSQWAAQPIVAAALTLVEGAAVGAAIGQMESQKSKLHTGGLAPDERYGMPQAITRNNERTAVLTQEGQRHLNELDRINAGAVGGGQILQVVVRDESGRGRRMSGRQFGKPIPSVGQAVRSVR